MMKRSVPVLLLAASTLHAVEGQNCTFSDACTAKNVKDNCDNIVDNYSDEAIEEACTFAFEGIAGLYYQQDKNFMDGDSDFHNDYAANIDKARVGRFLANAISEERVQWPQYDALSEYYGVDRTPYMQNFDLVDSCGSQTAVCCFAEGPTTNSEICHHDIKDSPTSSHINRGFAFAENTDAYCVGFDWVTDTDSDVYKGNLLAHVAYDTFMNGYTKNVPLGAPLCGCLEKMPTMTDAACKEVNVSGEGHSLTVSGSTGLVITRTSGTISFQDCGVTLRARTSSNAAAQKKLVGAGGCQASKATFLSDRMFVPEPPGVSAMSLYEDADPDMWNKVIGHGLHYTPYDFNNLAAMDLEFRALLQVRSDGTHPIIYRKCSSCLKSHQNIYYVRLTPIPPPDQVNFLDLFMSNWSNTPNNVLGTDFNLYSTYAEAVERNGGEWTSCNYNDETVGFPRDCGPYGRVNRNWNSYTRPAANTDYNGGSHVFYVENNNRSA